MKHILFEYLQSKLKPRLHLHKFDYEESGIHNLFAIHNFMEHYTFLELHRYYSRIEDEKKVADIFITGAEIIYIDMNSLYCNDMIYCHPIRFNLSDPNSLDDLVKELNKHNKLSREDFYCFISSILHNIYNIIGSILYRTEFPWLD